MFQGIACTIHAWAFAIPHAEHALDRLVWVRLDLLATQNRGGGKIFVDGGQELDVMIGNKRLMSHELLIDAERPAVLSECGEL